GEKGTDVFWGNELGEIKNYSEEVALEIDKEVKKLINQAEKEAERLIKQKKSILDKLAKTLIEKETIETEEFEKIVKAKRKK
ncbi:MAG TPA: cell division protein FtsH, partial [Candidatus Pacearchaeota archaeon]|nr:cell division protein FtsH [Candidatus Pacearchaeota archaeon]